MKTSSPSVGSCVPPSAVSLYLPNLNDGKSWVWLLIWAGILIRVGFFMADPNLWRDEAKYLMALEQTHWTDVVLEMVFGQRGALAPGWMLKGMIAAGWGEWVRFPFVILGSLALLGFARLARICFDDSVPTQMFAVSVFAFAPQLILFSNQAKGYGVDVLVTVVLLNIAVEHFRDPLSRKWHWAYPCIATASVMASMPSVFVLATLSCVALLWGNGRIRWTVCCSTALAGVVFVALYLARDSGFHYLPDYWNDVGKYASWNPAWWMEAIFISFYTPVLFPSFRYELIPLGCIFGGLGGLGLLVLLRNRSSWKWMALCCGPLFFCLAAAVFRQYPFATRLILFSAPCTILLLSFGVKFIWQRFGKVVMIPMAAFLALTLLSLSILEFFRPQTGMLDDWKIMQPSVRASDVILADLFQAQVLEYYRHIGLIDHETVVHEWSDESKLEGKTPLAEVVARLPDKSRIWLTAEAIDYHRSHTQAIRSEVEALRSLLLKERAILSEHRRARSTLILFGPALKQEPQIQ